MMTQTDNTPTVLVPKKGTQMSTQDGEPQNKCKVCGTEKNLTHVAIRDEDEELADVPDKRIIWLCENDYEAITQSREYSVRELPDDVEIDHDSHEEIEEFGENFVVILEEGNENKWLKVPDDLETDLSEER